MAKMKGHPTVDVVSKAGDELNELQINKLATEAEAGYDLGQAKHQRLGRPSLESGISPRVSFRTSRKLYDAARQRAVREGRTVSELAREAMEQYITSEYARR